MPEEVPELDLTLDELVVDMGDADAELALTPAGEDWLCQWLTMACLS